MVINLNRMEITCSECGNTQITINKYTKQLGICLKCREKQADENGWIKFTCYWCHEGKKANNEQRAENGICSNCEQQCSVCKETFSPTYNNDLTIRSNAEIENNQAPTTPREEHQQSCGRRRCEHCREWCIGTLELFNQHQAEHQQVAQIIQLPRSN